MRYPSLLTLVLIVGVVAGCGYNATEPQSPGNQGFGAADVVATAAKDAGSITIVLDMQPNRPTDISFETRGKKLRDFLLDDDVLSALPSSRTFTGLKPGSYTVTQEAVPGGTLLDIRCVSSANAGSGIDDNTVDVANRSVSIELENDESVTCTFVGSLPIWKTGDVISYSDLSWGEPPSETNAAGLLVANFNAVYPDGLFVGFIQRDTGSALPTRRRFSFTCLRPVFPSRSGLIMSIPRPQCRGCSAEVSSG